MTPITRGNQPPEKLRWKKLNVVLTPGGYKRVKNNFKKFTDQLPTTFFNDKKKTITINKGDVGVGGPGQVQIFDSTYISKRDFFIPADVVISINGESFEKLCRDWL